MTSVGQLQVTLPSDREIEMTRVFDAQRELVEDTFIVALLRSGECAGVTGVVLPRHRSAHLSPTVAKTAAGAIEHLAFAVVGRP